MKHISIFVTLTIFVAIISGCGEKMPDGMPALVKTAAVKVVQDGQPLADAKVVLVSDGGTSKWTVGGKTDATGTAKLVTHGQYPGAPEGKYKVIVSKREEPVSKYLEPQPGQSPEEFKALREKEDLTAYNLVDTVYGSASTTKATAEISTASPTAEVDVGKAVHVAVQESK